MWPFYFTILDNAFFRLKVYLRSNPRLWKLFYFNIFQQERLQKADSFSTNLVIQFLTNVCRVKKKTKTYIQVYNFNWIEFAIGYRQVVSIRFNLKKRAQKANFKQRFRKSSISKSWSRSETPRHRIRIDNIFVN